MKDVYFLLGSNLGDRLKTLEEALTMLTREVGDLVKMSSVYETEPWGITEQPVFLNQTVCIRTAETPDAILRVIKEIEEKLQRERYEKWGSRTIDVDILFYGRDIIRQEDLTIPHPAIQERNFTLVPLEEIAADFVHPVLQKTVRQMLRDSPDPLKAYVYEVAENIHFG